MFNMSSNLMGVKWLNRRRFQWEQNIHDLLLQTQGLKTIEKQGESLDLTSPFRFLSALPRLAPPVTSSASSSEPSLPSFTCPTQTHVPALQDSLCSCKTSNMLSIDMDMKVICDKRLTLGCMDAMVQNKLWAEIQALNGHDITNVVHSVACSGKNVLTTWSRLRRTTCCHTFRSSSILTGLIRKSTAPCVTPRNTTFVSPLDDITAGLIVGACPV